ncbi:hypothetical protein GGI17_004131 [Coemansia sp. S146]|nr:hypothetical protein GGI17_004131 [Coemansia sp. S146]
MEADDSDDDDGHVNVTTAHLRRGMDNGDESNGYYDSDHYDSYESESESDNDEHLINMFGPSCAGANVDIKLRTNIGLLRSAGQTGNVREIQTIVLGKSQTAGQLKRQLRLAGFGRKAALPKIERLRIDMRDSSDVTQTDAKVECGSRALKALNEYLSQALPSLCEIEYYGHNSKKLYHGVPIERLAHLATPTPDISLSSLQSLSLGFLATIEGSSQSRYESSGSGSEDSGDDSQYYDNVHYSIRSYYINSHKCNSPKLPVLRTLELHLCETNIKDDLQMFAASPISSLQLCCSLANVNGDWDLADFYRLRSFSIRIVDGIQDYCDTDISKTLSTGVFSC